MTLSQKVIDAGWDAFIENGRPGDPEGSITDDQLIAIYEAMSRAMRPHEYNARCAQRRVVQNTGNATYQHKRP